MKNRSTRPSIPAILAILAVAVILAAPAWAFQSESFPASPGGTLTLDLKSGAAVTVEIGTQNAVEVTVENADACRPRCVVEMDSSDDGVRIHTSFENRSSHQSGALRIHAVVPQRYNIKLDSMGGGLTVSGLNGSISGRTMGGELELTDLTGELDLVTMGGDIALTDSEVDGRVKTMGGTVLVESVRGDIEGKSMGGNVTYRNVVNTANPEASVGEEVFIDTMGGDIKVPDAPSGARVKTMGGDIRIESASEFVEATTMGGSIVIDSVDGSVKAITMGGDVDVAVTGAGGPIELSSNSGDVTLELPAGFSGHFQIELAYTRNSTRNYRIESDFALQVEESQDWDHSRGTARRYIYGYGSIGGGDHLIKLRTINGNVTVRSQ